MIVREFTSVITLLSRTLNQFMLGNIIIVYAALLIFVMHDVRAAFSRCRVSEPVMHVVQAAFQDAGLVNLWSIKGMT